MKTILLALTVIACVSSGMAQEQPPYKISDSPAINENFNVIFQSNDKHIHDGVDSSKMNDIKPSTGSTYDLGDATSSWRNVYVSSFVYVEDSSGSFVTKTGSGICYSLRVHDDGSVYTKAVTCP